VDSSTASMSIELGDSTTASTPVALTQIMSLTTSAIDSQVLHDFNGGFQLGGHTMNDIDITSEYSGADDHLMTAAAINARINDNVNGWTTNTGTVTSVTVGTGLDITNGTTTPNITVDLSEFTTATTELTSSDFVICLDGTAERKITLSNFANEMGAIGGWTTNTGDITGVTAGNGLTGGGASGAVTLTVGAGTGITVNASDVAITAAQTGITSMYNTSLQVGYSSTTAFIDFNATAMDFEWSSVPEFRMTSTGNFHADADITAYSTTTTSDRRYKKDIQRIPNSLDKINTLNGVTFKWKRDDKESAGLIAQDVEQVLPQAVCVKEALKTGEEYLALNYDCVVGMLVEAVKELNQKVEKLENR